jgi:hypothetical protein
MAREAVGLQEGRFPLQREKAVSTTENTGNPRETTVKIVGIFYLVRKSG